MKIETEAKSINDCDDSGMRSIPINGINEWNNEFNNISEMGKSIKKNKTVYLTQGKS
jgi:hypothetical protein